MDTTELDQLLRQTLTTPQLESSEKKSLIAWTDLHPSDGDRAFARSRAFALAKSAALGESLQVVEWLEDVVRVFSRATAEPTTPEKANAFFSPGKTCIQEVLRQFELAKESCDVCVFTITDDRITDAIIRAHARGVNVRVITDDEKSHDLGSDVDKLQLCRDSVQDGRGQRRPHAPQVRPVRRPPTDDRQLQLDAQCQRAERGKPDRDPRPGTRVTRSQDGSKMLWGRMKETAIPSPWAPTTDLPREGL